MSLSNTSPKQTAHRISPVLLALNATALGMVAQLILSSGQRLIAGLLYLCAAILIVYALRHQRVSRARASSLSKVESPSRKRWVLGVGIAAILFAVLALWQFGRDRPTNLAWLLHLTSLLLVWVAAFLWEGGPARSEDKWSRIELLLFLAILILATFMRLYRINEFPFGTYYDEADNGLQAERILKQADLPVYVESTNLPAHYLYLIALAFKLFGISTTSMRLASVAAGLVTVVAAYLTGRELFDRRMGLVAAFLLAVSRWDINWSRMAMHGVTTPMFELLSVGLLLRALRRERLTDFALAGLAVGIGLCFYVPFRVFPVVIVLFLLHRTLIERDLQRAWRGLLVMGVAALMAVSPVVQFALREPEMFWERTRWVSISTGLSPAAQGQALAESAIKHLFMFNVRGDPNPRHNLPGEPMLDPLSAALMVLGLALCLWRWREPGSLLLLAWWGVMLLGGIFSRSNEAPHSLRSIGSLPAAYLLAVVPLDGASRAWSQRFGQKHTVLQALWLFVLLGGIGIANYNAYFERQAKNAETWSAYSTGETITARLMVELGDSVEFYIPWDYHTSLTIPFIAGDRIKYQLLDNAQDLPLRQPVNKDVILIMDGERRGLYRDAKRYYPQATFQKYGPPSSETIVLYTVRLTPADVASALSQPSK